MLLPALLAKRLDSLHSLKYMKGFTLIEIVVAIFILMLIVFAFTPLLVGSIDRIYFAGDKSEALYQGQADMEVRIFEKQTADGLEIVFQIGDTTVTVPGYLIEVEHSEGRAEAWLGTFLPQVPSIHLSKIFMVEGFNSETVVILGRNTDIVVGDEVYIYPQIEPEDPEYIPGITITAVNKEPPSDLPAGFDQYASFDLPEEMTNANSPYTVELKWIINTKEEGEIEVSVATQLQVLLPFAVAAGDTVLVSPDVSDTWKIRDNLESFSQINDIIWYGFSYTAVNSNGEVIIWENRAEPEIIEDTKNSEKSLNSIAYSNDLLVAVGSGGYIIYSVDGEEWFESNSGEEDYELHAVNWNGNQFMAVGSKATIISSVDGINWTVNDSGINNAANTSFRGLTYAKGAWVIVGDEGGSEAIIIRGLDNIWSTVYSGTETNTETKPLQGVTANDSILIAVGNSGTILTSSDGINWDSTSITNNTLYDVVWDNIWENQFIIVGEAGTIITGNIGDWDQQTITGAGILKGAAVRWLD